MNLWSFKNLGRKVRNHLKKLRYMLHPQCLLILQVQEKKEGLSEKVQWEISDFQILRIPKNEYLENNLKLKTTMQFLRMNLIKKVMTKVTQIKILKICLMTKKKKNLEKITPKNKKKSHFFVWKLELKLGLKMYEKI